MRLFLCGFMGAGKTKVGRLVASSQGWDFLDLDQQIEAMAGKSVSEIFAQDGESKFRELEYRAVAETARFDNLVVALGGGAFTSARTRELISRLGQSVWLDVPFDLIATRLTPVKRATRPLFADEAAARRLYESRVPAYQLADFRLSLENEAPATEVAARIIPLLRVDPGEVPRHL